MHQKKIICSIGGGYSSTVKMPEVLLDQYSVDQIEFINCVLPNEHKSTWELMDSVSSKLGFSVTHIAFDPELKYRFVNKNERTDKSKLFTPFDIFDLVDFVGNTRVDPCSRVLKRKTIKNYVNDYYSPSDCVIAVGIHADEIDRAVSIRQNWQSEGYEVIFPIENQKKLTPLEEVEYMLSEYGVDMELYRLGFEHNNCHGACVKAGQKQWAMLWLYFPHIYKEWELREQQWINNHEGRAYPFLRKQINGKTHYWTLQEFREHVEESLLNQDKNFITRFIEKLPENPACMWCSAI